MAPNVSVHCTILESRAISIIDSVLLGRHLASNAHALSPQVRQQVAPVPTVAQQHHRASLSTTSLLRPTLDTDPLHFQLPPTKNFRPDNLEALEAKPRAADGAVALVAWSAAENMVLKTARKEDREVGRAGARGF